MHAVLFSTSDSTFRMSSRVGMKKGFPTFIHETAKDYENVFVSAGKVGYQIELAPEDLRSVVAVCSYADLIK